MTNDLQSLRDILTAERDRLTLTTSRDLDPFRASLAAAAKALRTYREDPHRTRASLPDLHGIKLQGDCDAAADALQRVESEASDAKKRIAELDSLLCADERAKAAAADLARIRADGEIAEKRVALATATIARLSTDLADADRKASDQSDALAERAMAGEPVMPSKVDHAREAAAVRAAIAAVERQRAAAVAQVQELAGLAAAARDRMMQAKLAQAELRFSAAMRATAPDCAALVAAKRLVGGMGTIELPAPAEDLIAKAMQALTVECSAWSPAAEPEPQAEAA